MPMIHRVRVSRVLPDLTTEQVFVVRAAGDQTYVETYVEYLRTRWMELNPGQVTVMQTDWPTPEELGMKCAPPARPEMLGW